MVGTMVLIVLIELFFLTNSHSIFEIPAIIIAEVIDFKIFYEIKFILKRKKQYLQEIT